MTLEERIEKLELELERTRRQRRVTLGLAAVVIVLGLLVIYPQGNIAAQGNTAPEIRARQIVLADETGNPRVGLFVGKDGPKLTLLDKKGKEHWSTPATK